MKQQLILALTVLITVVVVACNQNDVSPTNASVSTLATARIGGVTSGTATRGNSETVITASELPAAVITYLSTNYAGYTLVQAEQGINGRDGSTYYEVTFTLNGTQQELHFDMTGAVVAPSHGRGKGHGGNGNGGSSNEVVITADKLPAAALTYLTTNYAGYTLVQAEQGTDSAGAVYYEVKFTLNGVTKEIHFDAKGALI